jgi:hypothetical protein
MGSVALQLEFAQPVMNGLCILWGKGESAGTKPPRKKGLASPRGLAYVYALKPFIILQGPQHTPGRGLTFPSSSCSGLTSWVKISPERWLARGRWPRLSSRRGRNGLRGGRRGCQALSLPTCTSPNNWVPFILLTCQRWGVQSWQHLVLSGRGQRLEIEEST